MSSSRSSTLDDTIPTEDPEAHFKRTETREEIDLACDADIERELEGKPEAGEAKKVGALTLAEDDPENPRNWRTGKKVAINFALCIWVLTLTYSSTAYVASLFVIEREYGATQEASILGVTLMVLGFAAGPLIFGPASEMFGRQAVYRLTGLAYTGFTLGTAFAPNLGSMLAFRFFMGFFGSSSINNVPASIGDYTVPMNRGPYSILYAIMAFGGPALGPLCSEFIQTAAGFRYNFRVMATFVGTMSLLVALVPETHGPTLLKWRIKREGNAPPALTARQIVSSFKIALSRPIIYLLTEPVVTLVSLYLGVLYAILYGFFEAFTAVYLEIRGFHPTSYGMTYISLGLGFVVGCVLLATVGQRSYLANAHAAHARGEKVQPEARLTLAYFAGFMAPISLFIFAWTAPFPHVHWIAPCIAEFLFGASMLCIFTAFIPFLIDCYLSTAASALAAGMAFRACLGGVFPLFALQMYHKLTVQGATSLLAGLCLCLAPIPFVFRAKGVWMRKRSRHAVVV